MNYRNAMIAVGAAWVVGSFAYGQPRATDATEPALPATAPAESSAPPTKPLMGTLDALGVGNALRQANINTYGYIQAGYFYDTSSPRSGDGPTFIGFNSFKNQGIFDKIALTVERAVDPTQKRFDLGFRFQGIWGADAAFIHSNGMADDQSGRNQWDPLEGYVDVTIPDMPLRIRAGKWIELAGFEQFSANIYGAFGDPSRALYSYSYQFLYAEPGTQTGILATYVLNKQWSFDAGFTRGWNQSLEDTNDTIDFLGRITYTPSDKTSVIFVMTEGPEFSPAAGPNAPEGDNDHWWTALDLVVTHKVTDRLSLGVGIDYVHAPELPGMSGAQVWGGVAGYVSYALDPRLTLNGRVEWYSDAAHGFSTGAPFSATYYEATVGLAIKPAPRDRILANLLLRPEIRYDYSNRSVFDSGDNDQVTFSIDAIFTF